MVIKIRKTGKPKETFQYKSFKKILTPKDIKEADLFDSALKKEIQEIEGILIKSSISETQKLDTLKIWYLIGTKINKFLEKHKILPEEEKLFWDHLYGRFSFIHKNIPKNKIGQARNDFKIASILARYPIHKLEKINLWSLWREIITPKAFQDERVLNWILNKLENKLPETRDKARPFLKAVSARLKKIDTTVLSDKELILKLNDKNIKW